MNKLKKALLLAGCVMQSYAQSNDSVSAELTKALEQIADQGAIVGFSVAVVNEEGTLYEKGFGFADKQTNIKYTDRTVQNIASISKTFIGVALLKAQELGKLNLDDPVNDYLPFKVLNPHFPKIPITIRHLATHTSSIKDPARYEKNGYVLKEKNNGEAKVNSNFRSPDEMIPHGDFLKKILSSDGDWYKKSTYLKNSPGEMFEYSNIGAGLAAYVVENATGVPFPQFTKTHIFDPLQMSGSGWSFAAIDFSEHSKLYANSERELAFYHLVNYPDGGLITSSHDLAKYLTELISGYSGKGKLLSSDSYAELFKPQLTDINHKDRSDSAYNDEYNMGVFMGMSSQGQIGHTGGDPSVVTHMFFNEKTKVGKLLLVNTELDKDGIQEFIAIWKALIDFEDKL